MVGLVWGTPAASAIGGMMNAPPGWLAIVWSWKMVAGNESPPFGREDLGGVLVEGAEGVGLAVRSLQGQADALHRAHLRTGVRPPA